jgi:HD-GYP domain-containing protein (c-di-GMP phosphodiesterase class II)
LAGVRVADNKQVETQTPQALSAQTRDRARWVLARAYEEATTMPGTLLPNEILTDLRYMAWRILAEVLEQEDGLTGTDRGRRASAYHLEHPIDATIVGLLIGRKLLEREALEELGTGLFLQDIGNLALPPRLVEKEGPLEPDEWALMAQHPMLGLAFLHDDAISPAARSVVCSHHERWDGSGYPSGLAGHEISLFARIAAVADVFDAVTSQRYHAPAMDPRHAVELIRAGSGRDFDPVVVEAFVEAIDR